MYHPISKLGQCQNRSEAPQHWIHRGLGWRLFINSKNRKKRGLATLLPESSPVLMGNGIEMATTTPQPQLLQGENPGGGRDVTHVTGHAVRLLQEGMYMDVSQG